jgi:carboxypeptidase Q
MKRLAAVFSLMLAVAALPRAQATAEKLDYVTIGRIRDEGLNRSQVMDHISWLSDVYGPRLTGGPAISQAADWATKKFGEWGLANAHRETWAFGKGWSLVRFSAHMIEPQVQTLLGVPSSWTPGTKGMVTADVVRVQIDTEADFERYRGKLVGKIVLTQPARAVPMMEGPFILRMGDKEFEEAATTPIPAPRGSGAAGGRGRGGRGGRGSTTGPTLADRVQQFYQSEGVVALFNRGAAVSCRGSSSILMAARSSRQAAGRVATTPDRDCPR